MPLRKYVLLSNCFKGLIEKESARTRKQLDLRTVTSQKLMGGFLKRLSDVEAKNIYSEKKGLHLCYYLEIQ